jgi:hypothetical protein
VVTLIRKPGPLKKHNYWKVCYRELVAVCLVLLGMVCVDLSGLCNPHKNAYGKDTPRAHYNTPDGNIIWQRVTYSFYVDSKPQSQRFER